MVRRLSQTLVVACLVCLASATELVAQDLGDAERAQLEDWYRRTAGRTAGGEWGIAIGTMDGRVLWSVSPELELIPASTTKVFTTGFSRTTMGGDGRITTRVIGDGYLEPATGRWLGTWALELGGDPTLERSGRSGPTLRELAKQLRARGIATLSGPLAITSRTGRAASYYPSTWSSDFEGQLYAPPVGPVTLHENTVSLTFRPGRDVGSPPALVSAYPDGVASMVRIAATTVDGSRRRLSLQPLLVAVWAAALERAGIRWINAGGPVTLGPPRSVVLAQVESAPLDSVAMEINRRSLNIGAELLLQWAAGSQSTGPALLTEHVRRVVGPMARVHLVDGSGLSEENRMSPLTQMLYLARLPQLPGHQRFPLLLPANGTGTLRRLRYGMSRGVVHAKTGTLDDVATLTGYLGRPDGVLVISLMYNGRRIHAARAAEWELFRLLGAEGVDLGGALEEHMGGTSTLSDR
jgi:D-alanyl-D-alanine carboxypeptidase/D-alanyl-D-alanine-endopeptidase (penicillin-binding protein 4)